MPVRNIFYENPIYFLIKWVSKFSLFTLFFPSNTITISLMNLFCTSCSWVDSSHSKSESRVRVESFGAVDSSRVLSFFVLDSSRVESLKIATRVRVNDSTRYNTGWNRLLWFFEVKRKTILRSIYMVLSTVCVSA